MDDHRQRALTDADVERDLERALAVDPSPEFVARMRTRIATEAEPSVWWFGTPLWRRLSALRLWSVAAPVAVAILILIMVFMRTSRSGSPAIGTSLAARAIGGQPTGLPNVASGSSRASVARPSTSSGRAHTNTARGELVDQPPRVALRRSAVASAKVEPRARVGADTTPLLDPRETRALRSLIAGIRDNRVDVSALLRPGAPAPMELPPVDDLVIAPVAIEPIAPISGAQGVRQ